VFLGGAADACGGTCGTLEIFAIGAATGGATSSGGGGTGDGCGAAAGVVVIIAWLAGADGFGVAGRMLATAATSTISAQTPTTLATMVRRRFRPAMSCGFVLSVEGAPDDVGAS
jgi:hypothetical protein